MILEELGREWSWPAADEKCRKVVFDWARDLRIAYKHCRNFGLAIQAGGNMGVWPWLLSLKFDQVITFEPDPVCWKHLVTNLHNVNNIARFQRALLDRETTCKMETEKPDNLGAQFIVPGVGSLPVTTIDAHIGGRQTIDLIYLDIEGAELPALYGAVQTLAKDKPTVVIEDNGLVSRFGGQTGDIEKWLHRDFGYKVVARPHRDVVMVCK